MKYLQRECKRENRNERQNIKIKKIYYMRSYHKI